MFKNYSSEQFLRIVTIFATLFSYFGIDVSESDLMVTVKTITTLLVLTSTAVGYLIRWSKGDVSFLGARK